MRDVIIVYMWNEKTMQMKIRGSAMVERVIESLKDRFLGIVVLEVA